MIAPTEAARRAVVAGAATGTGAFTPAPYRVVERRVEADGVVSIALVPVAGEPVPWRPGQFNMLTAFGVGEVAISMSGVPGDGRLWHTVRDVGAVSHALCGTGVGDVVGVRGAFGTAWGVEELDGVDVVVVAGGIGLAPLRGAISLLAQRPSGRGGLSVALGARSPDQVIFAEDLERWRERGAEVELTVDAAAPGWTGSVGLVTAVLPRLSFDAGRAVALVCGPEVMMRIVARALVDRGVAADAIRVSLERNMQCGVGLCGHCQLGPLLICRDGPVRSYGEIEHLFGERER
ncbi:MAG TPA: FAD/NAD(P)-binding protein [Acidimicrobiales bacterium]|nr:FAD/NAD(P)-binding protein [Acidimicrobiales bacterium]